jgi:lactoylglutathione lyase
LAQTTTQQGTTKEDTMWTILQAAALAAGIGGGGAPESAAPAVRFDNVRLLVAEFDRSFAFYRDILGLQPTWGKPGENYASFAFPGGGGTLALFNRALMAEATGGAALPATRREQDAVALVLSTDDVDAVYAKLRGKGVIFVTAPEDRAVWGIRAAHFRDPDGNLIEIYSALRR